MSIEIQCREVARLRADLVAATDAELVVVQMSDDHIVVPSKEQMLAAFGDESSNFLTSLNAAYKLIQTTGNYDWQPRVLDFRQVRQARSHFDGTSLRHSRAHTAHTRTHSCSVLCSDRDVSDVAAVDQSQNLFTSQLWIGL